MGDSSPVALRSATVSSEPQEEPEVFEDRREFPSPEEIPPEAGETPAGNEGLPDPPTEGPEITSLRWV